MNSRIIVTTRIEGKHYWPSAPTELGHLRNLHRHMFHWRAEMIVTQLDRQVSFEGFVADLKQVVGTMYNSFATQGFTHSCEQRAHSVLNYLHDVAGYPTICAVECWEDGEHGARVERTPTPEDLQANPDKLPF